MFAFFTNIKYYFILEFYIFIQLLIKKFQNNSTIQFMAKVLFENISYRFPSDYIHCCLSEYVYNDNIKRGEPVMHEGCEDFYSKGYL